MSIRAKASKALTWSWLQAAVGAVLQLVTTTVMVRLLVPGDFGIIALATVFVRFLAYFSQLGFGVAIVQRDVVRPEELGGLSTLSVLIGACFTAIGFAAAFVVGNEVAAVLRVLSCSFLITGFTVIPYGMLRRELKYRELAIIELAGQVVGNGAVAITMAVMGCGVWSIVGGTLSQQAIVAAGSWYAANGASGRFTFGRPTAACRTYLQYGVRHSWNTFLEFIFYNVDVLVISNWFGVQNTGYFNRAYSLSHLAVEQVMTSVVRVLFPVLARLRGDREREHATFQVAFMLGGVFASGLCAAMFVAAPEIVGVLYGPKWIAIIPLVRIFAIAVPLRYLVNLQTSWLDALGVLRPRTITIAVCFIVKLAALPIALHYHFTLAELVALLIVPDFLWQLIYIAILPLFTSTVHRVLVNSYLVFAANALVVGGSVRALTWQAHALGLSSITTFIMQVCSGGLLVACVMLLLVRTGLLGMRRDALVGLPLIGRFVTPRGA